MRTTGRLRLERRTGTILTASTPSGKREGWSYRVTPIQVNCHSVPVQRAFDCNHLRLIPAKRSGLAEEIPFELQNLSEQEYQIPDRTAIGELVVSPTEEVTTSFYQQQKDTPENKIGHKDFLEYPVESRVRSAGITVVDPNTSTDSELDWSWEPADFPDALKPVIFKTPLDNEEHRKEFQALIYKYKEAFSLQGEIGRTDTIIHTIPTGDAKPVRQAPRRLPIHGTAEVDKCMKAMRDGGFIQKVEESEWASPIVMVKKKVPEGAPPEWRFAIDYRAVNALTRKSSHPLPRIEDTIGALGDWTEVHTLDIRQAYYHVPVLPFDQPKPTFVVP